MWTYFKHSFLVRIWHTHFFLGRWAHARELRSNSLSCCFRSCCQTYCLCQALSDEINQAWPSFDLVWGPVNAEGHGWRWPFYKDTSIRKHVTITMINAGCYWPLNMLCKLILIIAALYKSIPCLCFKSLCQANNSYMVLTNLRIPELIIQTSKGQSPSNVSICIVFVWIWQEQMGNDKALCEMIHDVINIMLIRNNF